MHLGKWLRSVGLERFESAFLNNYDRRNSSAHLTDDHLRELGLPLGARLKQALAVARRQGAKFWELRAASSLARLWKDQGRGDEARGLLAPIYGCFTEGFDMPDLNEAKALLAALTP
jgi:hypothetical protein